MGNVSRKAGSAVPAGKRRIDRFKSKFPDSLIADKKLLAKFDLKKHLIDHANFHPDNCQISIKHGEIDFDQSRIFYATTESAWKDKDHATISSELMQCITKIALWEEKTDPKKARGMVMSIPDKGARLNALASLITKEI